MVYESPLLVLYSSDVITYALYIGTNQEPLAFYKRYEFVASNLDKTTLSSSRVTRVLSPFFIFTPVIAGIPLLENLKE